MCSLTDLIGLVVRLAVTVEVRQAAAHVLVLHHQLAAETQSGLHGAGAVTGELCPRATENEYLILLQNKLPGVLLTQRQDEVSSLRGYI